MLFLINNYTQYLKDKLRDVEKKTELQALKHEEIMLELESIRARRERLLPLCPNCSSQTLNMYQPPSSTVHSSQQTEQQQAMHTNYMSPQSNYLYQFKDSLHSKTKWDLFYHRLMRSEVCF